MKNNKKRDIATSFTSVVFLVIGMTGVMMYFHILDKYTKDMHEILGLVFVATVIFHIVFNWKSMKSYFGKKIFITSAFATLLVIFGFVFSASSNKGENPKRAIIGAILKAPIEDAVNILGLDMDIMQIKLKKANIKYDDENSIRELARNNNTSPFRIISIINSK